MAHNTVIQICSGNNCSEFNFVQGIGLGLGVALDIGLKLDLCLWLVLKITVEQL